MHPDTVGTLCRDTVGGPARAQSYSFKGALHLPSTSGALRPRAAAAARLHRVYQWPPHTHMNYPSSQLVVSCRPRSGRRRSEGVEVAAPAAPAAGSLESSGYPQRQATAFIQALLVFITIIIKNDNKSGHVMQFAADDSEIAENIDPWSGPGSRRKAGPLQPVVGACRPPYGSGRGASGLGLTEAARQRRHACTGRAPPDAPCQTRTDDDCSIIHTSLKTSRPPAGSEI